MSKETFRYYLQNYNLPWTCLFCSMPKFSDSFFDDLNGEDFKLNQPAATELPEGDVAVEDYLAQTASKLALVPKDLRVAHLNICSIRNEMEELRALQFACNFDIFGITETHLDKSVPDNDLHIDDMRMFRQDRKKCKGGGCLIYCKSYLQVLHRKDLSTRDLEAILVQVKFQTANVLFSVIYRSELKCPNFFESAYEILVKAWLKTDHIFLMGDFNCDLLSTLSNPRPDVQNKTRKLLNLFEQFDMQNIVDEPTQVTPQTKTLIDLIVTTRPELIT